MIELMHFSKNNIGTSSAFCWLSYETEANRQTGFALIVDINSRTIRYIYGALRHFRIKH